MLKLRRTRSADAADGDEPSAALSAAPSAAQGAAVEPDFPADIDDDEGEEPVRGRMAPLGVGLRVTALVVVGIVMIAALALLGEARLSSIVERDQGERAALEKDRGELSAAISQAQRAEAQTSTVLAAYAKAAAAMVTPGGGGAAGDAAQKALTELAQSLEPLEAASRGLAVAITRSIILQPYEVDGIDPQAEASLIQRNRERAAAMLRTTRDLPGALAELVLEHEAMAGAARAGNLADARERHASRAAPKLEVLQNQLASLRTGLVDFGAELGERHAALVNAIHADAETTYEDQRSSIRLQIILLAIVLTAGAVFIALYGLAMPLADLAEAATRFSAGQYDAPVSVLGRRDEIGKLSTALEQLRESAAEAQRTTEEKLRQEREAERLARVQLEREVQQLRRDRDRLAREKAEAVPPPPMAPDLDEIRAEVRAEIEAQLSAESERRIAELTEQAQRQLADAEASAAHHARQLEAQHREALAQAEVELGRVNAELARLLAQPQPKPQPDVDLVAHREMVARLEAEIARLKGERGSTETEKDQEIARLRDELDKAQKAQVASVVGERELARLRAEFDNERSQLNKAAQDAHRRATAADQALKIAVEETEELARRHASEMALERQQRADEIERLKTAHARMLSETQRRLSEQFNDRIRVLSTLADDFEQSVSAVIGAVQSATGEVKASGARIAESAARSGERGADISVRVGRASAAIRAAVQSAEQVAAAMSDMAREAGQAARGTGEAIDSARAASGALQTLALSARRMSEMTQAMADLAERSNLLALNASIEAARAGEAGSGFTVVAAEVKALATRAARASKDISDRMAEIMKAIGDATSAFGNVGTTLHDIEAATAATARATDTQGAAARSLVLDVHAAAEGTEGVGRSVAEVTSAVDEASRAAARLQGAADTLAGEANALRRQVEEFLAAVRAT